jgi:hypothetical protein
LCFLFLGLVRTGNNTNNTNKKMAPGLINANPVIYEKKERRVRSVDDNEYTAAESIDQLEVFDILFTFFLSFFNSIQFFFLFPVCSRF